MKYSESLSFISESLGEVMSNDYETELYAK